jgi:glutathione S-transferase
MSAGATPIVYGESYSVYVRAVRMALDEKGVAYRLVPVDVFAPGGPPAEHFQRHPFGRIPAFEHAGFRLYEAGAITRYIDEAFPGPALQPADPPARARMTQVIGVMDSYFYRPLVWDIYVERVAKPARGEAADEARIAAALPKAATCLAALSDLLGEGPWFAGAALSLADLHAAPMFTPFRLTPESEELLRPHPSLDAWWRRASARPSFVRTQTPPRHARRSD